MPTGHTPVTNTPPAKTKSEVTAVRADRASSECLKETDEATGKDAKTRTNAQPESTIAVATQLAPTRSVASNVHAMTDTRAMAGNVCR